MVMEINIRFEKPKSKEGFMGVDMHTHGEYSNGFQKIKNMVKKAEKKNFGFAITDYHNVKGYKEAKKAKTLVIPGMEFSSREGFHILTYFNNYSDAEEFREKFLKNYLGENPLFNTRLKGEKFIEEAKKYNALMSFAHPFAPVRMGIMKSIKKKLVDVNILDKINSFEVMHSVLTRKENRKAIELAEKRNALFTAGSDAHSLYQLGSVQRYTTAETPEEFLEQIRKKKGFIMGKEQIIRPKVSSLTNYLKATKGYIKPTIKLKYEMFFSRSDSYYKYKLKDKSRKTKQ